MSGIGFCQRWFLRTRVILAICFSQCCVGGYNVILGEAVKNVDPLIFSLLRDVGAVICYQTLLCILMQAPPWRTIPKARDLWRFIVYGCCHVYFGQYYMVMAAHYAHKAMLTSVWLNTGPVFVCLFSLGFGVEKLDLTAKTTYSGVWKLIGLALTVIGSLTYVILSLEWDNKGNNKVDNLLAAHLYMFFEVFAGGGVFHTIEKVILKSGYSACQTAAWGYTFGGLLLLLMAIPQLDRHNLGPVFGGYGDGKDKFVPTNWYYIGYALFVNSFVSSLAFTWANKKSSPIFVNAWRPLQTVVTALFVWWFHNEIPTEATGVGAAIIVPGVWALLVARYLETRGKKHYGDDDKQGGGPLAMQLRSARLAREDVEAEVRALEDKIMEQQRAQAECDGENDPLTNKKEAPRGDGDEAFSGSE